MDAQYGGDDTGPRVIEWLLDSDPSIRWQVMRDLLDRPKTEWSAERRSFVEERHGGMQKRPGSGQLMLADLSLRPRLGVKGSGTIGWMKRQAVTVPTAFT